MTKQEKIQEAYGEYWDIFKEFVNENGWFHDKHFWGKWPETDLKWETTDHDNDIYDKRRPKSLKGIENNNGWIKIESEADLPEKEFYKGYETFPVNYRCNSYGLHKYFKSKEITHYQPITKPNPPIY